MAPALAKTTVFLPKLNPFSLQESTLLFLAEDSSTPSDLLDQIGRVCMDRPGIIGRLVDNPATPEETLILIGGVETFRVAVEKRLKAFGPEREGRGPSVFARVQQMSVAEKIQLALKGSREARALLIKEPNKQVCRSVLANPKITDQEIELIAQSKNVSDEVLRIIAANKNWTRNYNVIFSLASNPRTPVGITLGFVKMLKTKDLGLLSKNRGVAEALRAAAAKMLRLRQQKG